jgi:hypothetical protein
MSRPRLATSLVAAALLLAPFSPFAPFSGALAQDIASAESFVPEAAVAAEPAALPLGTSVAPVSKDDCPVTHPIKGNRSGRQASRPSDPIYHTPSSRWYAVTDPEECFATAADAEAAGYRAPLR